MGDLRQRAWRITVDTIEITKLDVEFTVKKTLKAAEPNTCDLKIFNMNSDHRKQVEQKASKTTLQKVPVSIEAGYFGTKTTPDLAQIFLGELRAGWTVNDGADVVTELSTGDGEKGIATARLNVSFGPGAPIDVVLREIVKTLGVGQGNVQKAVSLLQAKGLVQFSTKSVVIKGNAADHLTNFCKSAGLEWSVQDNAIQILTLGQPLAGQSLLLNASTGLIGSPSVDSKGVLTAQTLMIPGVRPGQLVTMDSIHVKGGFRIDTCEYTGDTMGNDWYIKITGSKY